MPHAMVDALSSASNGLRFAVKTADVAANNIANVDTQGYSAVAVTGGPDTESRVSTGRATPDLAVQIPALSQAKDMMQANVAVMKQAQAMYASVLQLLPPH